MALLFVGPPEIGYRGAEFGAVDGHRVIICLVERDVLEREAAVPTPTQVQLLSAFRTLRPRIQAAASAQYDRGELSPTIKRAHIAASKTERTRDASPVITPGLTVIPTL
jgi:hypothetical protein